MKLSHRIHGQEISSSFPESFYVSQRFLIDLLVRERSGHSQCWSALRSNQFGWHQKQTVANGLKIETLPTWRKTETSEPIQKVVGKKHKMEVSLIRSPLSGGDFPQGIGFDQLPNNQFAIGTLIVKAPHVQRPEQKICHEHTIGVTRHLEKRKLPRRFFGNEPTHHNKPFGTLPPLWLIGELAERQLRRYLLVVQVAQSQFDWRLDMCRNDIKSLFFGQKRYDFVAVESRIRTNADRTNARRKPFEDLSEKLPRMWGWLHIPRQIPSRPYIFGVPFEAEQRLVGWTASFLGIVTNPCSLLLTVNCQNRSVQIEDNRRRLVYKIGLQPIVQTYQLIQTVRSQPRDKSSQARRVWIRRQPRDVLEDSVLLKQSSGLDASKAQNDRIKNGQDRIADGVVYLFSHAQRTILRSIRCSSGLSSVPPQGCDKRHARSLTGLHGNASRE